MNVFNLRRGDDDNIDYLQFEYEAPEPKRGPGRPKKKTTSSAREIREHREISPSADDINSILRDVQQRRARGSAPYPSTDDESEQPSRTDYHTAPSPSPVTRKQPVTRKEYAPTSTDIADDGSKAVTVRIPKDKVGQHQLLCLQLYAYASHERFAPAIRQAGLRVIDLDKKTVPQLEELLQRCRIIGMNSLGTSGGMLHQGAWAGCNFVEKMAPKRICDLTGFAERVCMDEEAKLLMDLASIDYGFASSMPLPIRIASCIGRIGMRVAAENQALVAAQSNAAGLQRELDQMRQQQMRPTAPPALAQAQQTIQDQTQPVYQTPFRPAAVQPSYQTRPPIDPVQNVRPMGMRDWE